LLYYDIIFPEGNPQRNFEQVAEQGVIQPFRSPSLTFVFLFIPLK